MKETQEKDTFNMVINKDLKKDFIKKCIDNGTDMSKVLRNFIEKYTYEM